MTTASPTRDSSSGAGAVTSSTQVLDEVSTATPGAPTQLPFTGPDLPVRAALLLAIALVTGGALLILVAGAGPFDGSHRRRL